LSAGDWDATQPLTVKMDPRVQNAGVTKEDLEAQFALNRDILDAIGTARATAYAIDSVRTRLRTAVENGQRDQATAQSTLDRLDALHAKLATTTEGSYPPPKLIDQLEYLYYMTSAADQNPGSDAPARFQTLDKRLSDIRAEWKQLRRQLDLPTTD